MKVSVKLIMALYAGALRVLDASNDWYQSNPSSCAMGHTLIAFLKGAKKERPTEDYMLAEGMPSWDFSSIWTGYFTNREDAASALRDLADKYVLALRGKRNKLDVAALLRTARKIEDNANEYQQEQDYKCILGILNGGRHVDEDDTPTHGLTVKQWRKLYWYGFNNEGRTVETMRNFNANFGKLTPQQRADKAAARIRRMVIQGT